MKAIRNVALALTLTLTGATSLTHPSAAQAQAASPTTTAVMVILTVEAGATREQVMAVRRFHRSNPIQFEWNTSVSSGWSGP